MAKIFYSFKWVQRELSYLIERMNKDPKCILEKVESLLERQMAVLGTDLGNNKVRFTFKKVRNEEKLTQEELSYFTRVLAEKLLNFFTAKVCRPLGVKAANATAEHIAQRNELLAQWLKEELPC